MLKIDGDRIYLKELEQSDWRGVHSYASHELSSRYQAWGPNTEEDSLNFVREAVADCRRIPRTRFLFVIIHKGDDKVIGAVDLTIKDIHNRAGAMGYIIHPDSWGNGYATEASKQLIHYGFRELKLHRIYATCNPENIASIKVLEKNGMTREGRMRDHLKIKEGWRDSLLYSILEDD
ncbi:MULTISPECIES: GNAT family N-acetyltransferase [Rossellomorea]|uniref:GNAT family N-acetyltransferase n=1 Tax=Rossellomorea TaxID=2837508 RepID=UPI0016539AF7|nr:MULTISPECIES: GNAT family protein [Rossellomorea]